MEAKPLLVLAKPARPVAEARLDPEWVAEYGEWSKAAALALIGTTAPSARPKRDRNGGDGAEGDDAE